MTALLASDQFSKAEKKVLPKLSEGLSNKDIANKLHLSVATIKTHIYSMMKKTKTANRMQLAIYAQKNGLLD